MKGVRSLLMMDGLGSIFKTVQVPITLAMSAFNCDGDIGSIPPG